MTPEERARGCNWGTKGAFCGPSANNRGMIGTSIGSRGTTGTLGVTGLSSSAVGATCAFVGAMATTWLSASARGVTGTSVHRHLRNLHAFLWRRRNQLVPRAGGASNSSAGAGDATCVSAGARDATGLSTSAKAATCMPPGAAGKGRAHHTA